MAAPKQDAAATKLDKDAMEKDFLNADFDAAEKKLRNAVKTCGESGCTPKLKAQILVHLGIIQVNQQKADDGKKSFVEALKIDNTVAPEGDFVSPDVEKNFNEAKKMSGGGGTAGTAAPPDTGKPDQPENKEGISHTTVEEQMINTPVPIFVKVPEGLKVATVIVYYKGFGATEWKKLELKKMGEGYGGMIPCEEVGSATGDMKYYIKALDEGKDTVDEIGKASKPLVCKIKTELQNDPPHLPKQPPPAQCQGIGECPPGFPCAPNKKHLDQPCDKTSDCDEGLVCNGVCEKEGSTSSHAKKNWIGLHLSYDLALISGNDVCGQESQNNKGYSCFRSSDEVNADSVPNSKQYHGNPLPNAGNAIAGGLAPSTFRIMASYDRLIGKNITIGARLGFAFGGGPKPDFGNSFLPVHLEARFAYWIGNDPMSKPGLRPFVFINGGMAQVDTKVQVTVRENPDPTICNPGGDGRCQVYDGENLVQTNPQSQKVDAWHKAGQSFIGLGGGIMYAFNARSGVVFDLKFMEMFPTTGSIISPELGYMMGF